jgi:rhodopsin domain-containing protein
LSHLIIKLSYFAFYLRLLPDPRQRLAVYAGTAFVAAVGITFTVISVFMCTPIQRGWDKSVPGTCVDAPGFLLSNAALNMVADAVVFLMPIPTLWTLHREETSYCLKAARRFCGG